MRKCFTEDVISPIMLYNGETMQKSLTGFLAWTLAGFVAITYVASFLGFALFQGSMLMAAFPGVLAAILCMIAGVHLLKAKLRPLEQCA